MPLKDFQLWGKGPAQRSPLFQEEAGLDEAWGHSCLNYVEPFTLQPTAVSSYGLPLQGLPTMPAQEACDVSPYPCNITREVVGMGVAWQLHARPHFWHLPLNAIYTATQSCEHIVDANIHQELVLCV